MSRAEPGNSEFTLQAWVDESMHDAVPGVSDPMYLLAAAVADPSSCEPIRQSLRNLVPNGDERLHWHDADELLQGKVAEAIAGLDCCNLVVVGVRADHRQQERARRKCMEQLVFRLKQIGVSQIWIESRTQSLNAKDKRMFDALRSRRFVGSATRFDFAYPRDEPMLWIPDAVAGATGMARKGVDPQFRAAMGDVEEIEIAIRRG